MSRRVASLIAVSGAVAGSGALLLTGGASGASGASPSSRALHIALKGKSGISVSGSPAAGATRIVATHTGHGQGQFALVRLNPDLPPAKALAQGFAAVNSHHGDLNALTGAGSLLLVDAGAPGKVETVLKSGNWAALNITGNGQPAVAQFTVKSSSAPSKLPAAKATQTAIEFGFHGPSTLHRGTLVREQNHGYLVHMIDLIGVRNRADVPKVIRKLRAGVGQKKLRPFLNGRFVSLLGPASPGALQQGVLDAKPGYYVEACFMDTQDGREHTQLGMERAVRVVG